VIDASPGPVLASLADIVARLDAAVSDASMDDSIEFAMERKLETTDPVVMVPRSLLNSETKLKVETLMDE
jgi:hypothetical protein